MTKHTVNKENLNKISVKDQSNQRPKDQFIHGLLDPTDPAFIDRVVNNK